MADGRPGFFDSALYEPVMRAFTKAHVAVFQLTRGRLAGRFRFASAFPHGVPVGLLTTVGRKSGRPRTMALIYMPDGDRCVFVASRGGTDRHPQWYLNILAQPEVHVQIRGRRSRPYTAYEAEGEEREELYRRLVAFYPEYGSYQKWTERRIPVIVCAPVSS